MRSPYYQSSRFWSLCFLLWFILLNFLSHGDKFHPDYPPIEIPHLDKIIHFGYFFGGAGLLSAAYFFKKHPSWTRLVLGITLTLSLIGIWDEYHQSFFQNRSGNDLGDWLADTLGALFGALTFRLLHHRLL